METHLPNFPPRVKDLTPLEVLAGCYGHRGGPRGTRVRKSMEPYGHWWHGCTSRGMEAGRALESSPGSGGAGSTVVPGLCHTWQAAAGRRRLQRATWLQSPLGGQRHWEQAGRGSPHRIPEINLQVRVLPVGHRASPTPPPSLLARGADPSTAIAQGFLHGAETGAGTFAPAGGRDRMGKALGYPGSDQGMLQPSVSGRGCPAEVKSCLHQQPLPDALDSQGPSCLHQYLLSPSPPPSLQLEAGEGSAHHSLWPGRREDPSAVRLGCFGRRR